MSQMSAVQGQLDLFGWKAIGDAIERHSQPQHLDNNIDNQSRQLPGRLAATTVVGQGVEIVAKRLEHWFDQTPAELEFHLGPAEKPHRERHSICAGRFSVCQFKIGP